LQNIFIYTESVAYNLFQCAIIVRSAGRAWVHSQSRICACWRKSVQPSCRLHWSTTGESSQCHRFLFFSACWKSSVFFASYLCRWSSTAE